MAAKSITSEYVDELIGRINLGETPEKNTEISPKEFIKRMLPHVKSFLAQGYTLKEIAAFIGHVSAADLKRAVARDCETREKALKKEGRQEKPAKAVTPKASPKEGKEKKARQAAA